jgi:hypothetical protein
MKTISSEHEGFKHNHIIEHSKKLYLLTITFKHYVILKNSLSYATHQGVVVLSRMLIAAASLFLLLLNKAILL